jgi:hypothetical protein
MKKEFAEKLNQFLESECSDYDLSYTWEWVEDCSRCEVTINRNSYINREANVNFKFEEKGSEIMIELSEDNYMEIREYDYTVKYFWMLISPHLFPID